MTQKELLYFEDAINHETNLIKICEETMNLVEDESLCSFFEKEIKEHEKTKKCLMDELGGKTNER